MLSLLWSLFLFLRFANAIQLSLPDQFQVNTSVPVNWTRTENEAKRWDLRLTLKDDRDENLLVMAGMDVGEATAGVQNVTITRAGRFKLTAVVRAGPNHSGKFDSIGTSDWFNVTEAAVQVVGMGMVSVSTQSSETSTSESTQPTQTPSNNSATGSKNKPGDIFSAKEPTTMSPSMKMAVITGSALGGVVLLLGGIVLFIAIRRRRRRAKTRRQVIFHRELMVQRRPGPYPVSAMVSVDVERANT